MREICTTCGFEKKAVHIHGDEWDVHCSDFCAEVGYTHRKAFLTLKAGEWGYFPCAKCGTILEDIYSGPEAPLKERICSGCHKRIRFELTREALERALPFLPEADAALAREALDF
jgi:hypothetical protein